MWCMCLFSAQWAAIISVNSPNLFPIRVTSKIFCSFTLAYSFQQEPSLVASSCEADVLLLAHISSGPANIYLLWYLLSCINYMFAILLPQILDWIGSYLNVILRCSDVQILEFLMTPLYHVCIEFDSLQCSNGSLDIRQNFDRSIFM